MNLTTSLIGELPHLSLALLIVIGTSVGVLIGSVGVGGILLVPALVYLTGVDIHIAIASCLFSYAFNGLVGTWLYTRKGSIQWQSGIWLCTGAMPGAWLGATWVAQLESRCVVLIIAAFISLATIHSMYGEWRINRARHTSSYSIKKPEQSPHSPLQLLIIGAITGTGSAFSGSGGPLVLVPVLVWLGWPVLTAVGLGQIIQVPISLTADVANFQSGSIDLPLALTIALTVTSGVTIGARIAHRVPAQRLQRWVNTALLLTASWMIVQAGIAFASHSQL